MASLKYFESQFIRENSIWECLNETLTDNIVEAIWTARASSTVQKYCYSLRKLLGFFRLHDWSIRAPFSSLDVAQYVTFLMSSGGSKSAITTVYTAAKWLNAFFPGINKFNDSLNDEFLSRLIASGQRALSRPKVRKAPLTGDLVKDILKACDRQSLKSIRDTLVPVLCYSLLLRYNELSNSSCAHIKAEPNHYRFTIPIAENDQLRSGRSLFLSRTEGTDATAKLLEAYLARSKLALGTNHFLLCPLRYDSLSKQTSVLNKPLSYTVCREIIKGAVEKLGLDPSLYSTHSARAGGATDLAPHTTPLELQTSGRWNDPRSITHYVDIPLERRLSISRLLSLDNYCYSGQDDATLVSLSCSFLRYTLVVFFRYMLPGMSSVRT